jgi:starch synthase (maltosyl-transferring)
MSGAARFAGVCAREAEVSVGNIARLKTPAFPLEQAMASDARIVIDRISPSVDLGRYAVKWTVGSPLTIEADIFADGHEQIAAAVAIRSADGPKQTPMIQISPDRWQAVVEFADQGTVRFRVEAWLDVYGGLVRDISRKTEAGQPIGPELQDGRTLISRACNRSIGATKQALATLLQGLDVLSADDRISLLLAEETRQAMQAADNRPFLTRSYAQMIQIERTEASFASWYELFPRSQSAKPGRHGTLRDVTPHIPRIRAMGFDVLYLTPIHPIGHTNRKGRNNALKAGPDDPGSTYAIGSEAGGHDAIHPDLGTIDDFHALIEAARHHGMELALDFAAQMSPDHPWLKEQPNWFYRRPDGSMKFAENPPKKYEDIVNPDFYSDSRLWIAFRDVFLYWAEHGVRIFRVDNPHTKPMPFWEWIVDEIKAVYPDALFLSEAFTRPLRMYHLAKAGFSQSYTYFTWRNSKAELTQYLTELTQTDVRDYFRPNFFVNTPDINPPFLQTGGRPAFLIRAALAATMSGLWGIYSGFELCEADALPGREEYLDSEKYEIKHRDFDAPGNIQKEIAQLNMLRRMEPALQSHLGITFYNAFNDNVIYYAKSAQGRDDKLLIAVNLDPHSAQECDFEIPLWEWGLSDHDSVQAEDLLHGHKFTWHGKIQHLRLEPAAPYAIWRIRPGTAL